MKANELPKKIYLLPRQGGDYAPYWRTDDQDSFGIEYTRTDAFIEKASEWFKKRYEWIDIDGIRNYDKSAFEDFKNYLKGE